MWESRSSSGRASALAGILIAGLFLVVAALLFGGIFLLLPGKAHFAAFLTIGFLSLVFAVVSYFAQAFSREPMVQRAAAWGFSAFGFAILFLTVGLFPSLYGSDLLSTLGQFALLIVLVLLLIVAAAVGIWRAHGRVQDERRDAQRGEWNQSAPPSAFSYAAARDPAAPSSGTNEPPRGGV
jgi:hypothetical protein